jgi:signal transduction histidine kinase
MLKPLRALIVEDSEDDALLLVRALERGGYAVTSRRVETADDMTAALDAEPWDIIFSDFKMPSFTGMAALALIMKRPEDIPFVLVSGTIGEDTAVEALKAGAHDFLLKGNLSRLIPAVGREMREAEARRQHREAEAERQRLQAQLMVSDRLASIGTLAAGVAHELNNPLAAIMANVDLVTEALRELPPFERSDELLACLTDAHDAADRMRHIIGDLKLFSRAEDAARGPVDVHRVLDVVLRMAGNEIRHRARLLRQLSPVPPVFGNESRVAQVFLNLIINAAQSIAEGNTAGNEIRVATSVNSDGKVVVEVTDTGCGMSEDVKRRLFTPFFTTKPVGQGMGLGLSICHYIVQAMGGSITVESTEGSGSTFRVTLPAATGPLPRRATAPATAGQSRRGRLLVIDDEPIVGRAMQRVLEAQHDVVVMTRAQQALEAIANGQHFDAILCDVMMPEMSGIDFYTELAQRFPAVTSRVIFLTGGAFTARSREFLDTVAAPYLDKPCNMQALLALVDERVRMGEN